MNEARATYAAAHGLAAVMGLTLIALFLPVWKLVALLADGGSEDLTGMGPI